LIKKRYPSRAIAKYFQNKKAFRIAYILPKETRKKVNRIGKLGFIILQNCLGSSGFGGFLIST